MTRITQRSRSRRPRWWGEHGAATLELVGIAVAITLLVGGLAVGLRGEGGSLGARVGDALQRQVTGAPAAELGRTDAGRTEAAMPSGRWRSWRERRVGGGDVKVHVPRDSLRLSPALQPRSFLSRAWERAGERGPVQGRARAEVCVLCLALEWSRDARTGASTGSEGRFLGGEGSILGEARLALAAADAMAGGSVDYGPLTIDARGRLRAAVGAEASLGAVARLNRQVQQLELEAGAMLGASAKAEGRVGAALVGVAVEQGGQVEGWAGIGVRGEGGVHREGGRLSWKVGWGAALGVGGAAEWSGSVDVSKFPNEARRIGTRTLRAGIDLVRGG